VLLGSSNLERTCAQNMTGRGGAGKDSGSKSCRGAEHGQAGTKDPTGAVALRAAVKSGVQLGRGLAKLREATKGPGKPKWPTLRNVGICYRDRAEYARKDRRVRRPGILSWDSRLRRDRIFFGTTAKEAERKRGPRLQRRRRVALVAWKVAA
jgi:hypothetical protein